MKQIHITKFKSFCIYPLFHSTLFPLSIHSLLSFLFFCFSIPIINSYPILRQLLDTPITDTPNLTSFTTAPITDTSNSTLFTAVIHTIPRQSFHPPPNPTLIVRPREFLPPPGQFLATKRLTHHNEVYYKFFHQYNELLKSHEGYLDSLLLANSFHNMSVNT